MPIYNGSKKISNLYIGSRKIGKVYYGATLVYTSWEDKEFTVPGVYSVSLPRGVYKIVIRSAGGAGGSNGSNYSYAGGSGGVGGKGHVATRVIVADKKTNLVCTLGTAGAAKGGNGGIGRNNVAGVPGGNGGGGAMPSYVKDSENNVLLFALGGAGGGGGGGGVGAGRRCVGGGGGAGGGWYDFVNGEVISYNGADGPTALTYYGNGVAGANGPTASPDIRAGSGGWAWHHQYGNMAGGIGYGASGASGTAGDRNNHTHDSAIGGLGGGGNGGDADAGGGAVSGGPNYAASNGYNHKTVPTDVAEENTTYEIPGNWGRGGEVGMDGTNGIIKIIRITYEED